MWVASLRMPQRKTSPGGSNSALLTQVKKGKRHLLTEREPQILDTAEGNGKRHPTKREPQFGRRSVKGNLWPIKWWASCSRQHQQVAPQIQRSGGGRLGSKARANHPHNGRCPFRFASNSAEEGLGTTRGGTPASHHKICGGWCCNISEMYIP